MINLAAQPKRNAMIAFALIGFYLTSSVPMAMALFIVGAFCYFSIVLEAMRQLPPLTTLPPPQLPTKPAPSLSTPSRILRFMPLDNPGFVIQQNTPKPRTSLQSSGNVTNTPNSSLRVKI